MQEQVKSRLDPAALIECIKLKRRAKKLMIRAMIEKDAGEKAKLIREAKKGLRVVDFLTAKSNKNGRYEIRGYNR